MEAFWTTFGAVLFVELTDRTRLIAMILSARYRSPVQLIAGMTLGYVPAVAVAVWGAGWLTTVISPRVLTWLVALVFILFGIWLLARRPETDEDFQCAPGWLERMGPFWIGLALVAVTEFADKSQIATAGMMMRYGQASAVFFASLGAQALLNIVYVCLGNWIGGRIPAEKIRFGAGLLFLVFGLIVLFKVH